MKKLITIILALIMTLFTAPNQDTDQPHVTAVETPETAITTTVEQVLEEIETTAETALVSEVKETETVTGAAPEEELTVQETVAEESIEIAEETVMTEPEEDTVEQLYHHLFLTVVLANALEVIRCESIPIECEVKVQVVA